MTSIFLALFFSAFVGYVLWILAESLEKKRGQIAQESLQAQIQLANNRANQLHTDLVRVQTELLQSARSLEAERTAKENALQELARPWKRFRVPLLLTALGIGICFGIYAGVTQTEKYFLKKTIQLEVSRSVAQSQMEFLRSQIENLTAEVHALRQDFQVEMQARVQAETELAILSGKKNGGSETRTFGFNFSPLHPAETTSDADQNLTPWSAISAQ